MSALWTKKSLDYRIAQRHASEQKSIHPDCSAQDRGAPKLSSLSDLWVVRLEAASLKSKKGLFVPICLVKIHFVWKVEHIPSMRARPGRQGSVPSGSLQTGFDFCPLHFLSISASLFSVSWSLDCSTDSAVVLVFDIDVAEPSLSVGWLLLPSTFTYSASVSLISSAEFTEAYEVSVMLMSSKISAGESSRPRSSNWSSKSELPLTSLSASTSMTLSFVSASSHCSASSPYSSLKLSSASKWTRPNLRLARRSFFSLFSSPFISRFGRRSWNGVGPLSTRQQAWAWQEGKHLVLSNLVNTATWVLWTKWANTFFSQRTATLQLAVNWMNHIA